MPTALAQFGLQQAGNAIGTGMGLLLEKHEDKRQLNQQSKLQELQMQGQRSMTDYNFQKELEMWHNTNYKAQMEELEKAGLNPGLIYGMGGGGGATTDIKPGNVTGAEAPKGGQEIPQQQGMAIQRQQIALQMQLLEAQKANIEADTANKQADTANKPKTGANIEASTKSILQGIKNQQAQEALTKITTEIEEINWDVISKGENYMIGKLYYEQQKLSQEIDNLKSQKKITDIEGNTLARTIKLEQANKAIDSWLKAQQGAGISQAIRESIDRMKTAYQNRLNQVDQQSNENMGSDADILENADNAFPDELKGILQAIGLGSAAKTTIKGKPTQISGFHKRN